MSSTEEKSVSVIVMEVDAVAVPKNLPSLGDESRKLWEKLKYGKVFCLTFKEGSKGFGICETTHSLCCLVMIAILTMCVELIPATLQLANLEEANEYIEGLAKSVDEDYQLETLADGLYLREHIPCLTLAPVSEDYCLNNTVNANITFSSGSAEITACFFCDGDRGYGFVSLNASLPLCGYSTPNMREAGVSAMCTSVDGCLMWIADTRYDLVDRSRTVKESVSALIRVYLFITVTIPFIFVLIWVIAGVAFNVWVLKLKTDKAYRDKILEHLQEVLEGIAVDAEEKFKAALKNVICLLITKIGKTKLPTEDRRSSRSSCDILFSNIQKMHHRAGKCKTCLTKLLNLESYVILYIFCGVPFMMSNLIIGYMYGVVDNQRNLLAEENITGCWLTSSSLFIYEELFQGFLSTIYIQIFLVWMSFAEQTRLIYHLTDPFKMAYTGYMSFVADKTKQKLESLDGLKQILRLWKSLYELNEVAYDPMTILFSLVAAGAFLQGKFWGESSGNANMFFLGYLVYLLVVWFFLVQLGGREAIYKSPYRKDHDICKYINCPNVCIFETEPDEKWNRRKLVSCPAFCICENDSEKKDTRVCVCCVKQCRKTCKPICKSILDSRYCIFELENETECGPVYETEREIKNLLSFWVVSLVLIFAVPSIFAIFLREEFSKFN